MNPGPQQAVDTHMGFEHTISSLKRIENKKDPLKISLWGERLCNDPKRSIIFLKIWFKKSMHGNEIPVSSPNQESTPLGCTTTSNLAVFPAQTSWRYGQGVDTTTFTTAAACGIQFSFRRRQPQTWLARVHGAVSMQQILVNFLTETSINVPPPPRIK